MGSARPTSGSARSSRRSKPRASVPAPTTPLDIPHELSGGQRQRVVIAGALVMDPTVIVADEPVSMLDVSIRTELLRLMLDLRQERGLTYLFITHDLSLAWVIADRIAVMYLGKIMEIGPAEAVIRSPRNPTRRPSSRCRRLRIHRRRGVAPSARSSRARRPTPPTSRAVVGSTPGARWRSTGAGSRSRRCSTSAAVSPPPAGSRNRRWSDGGRGLPVVRRRRRRRPSRRGPTGAVDRPDALRVGRGLAASVHGLPDRPAHDATDGRADQVDPQGAHVAADQRRADRASRVHRGAAEGRAREVDRDERQRDGERRRGPALASWPRG